MPAIGNHHRVPANVVSKMESCRKVSLVHSFVLAVFRDSHSVLRREFGNGLAHEDKEYDPRVGEPRFFRKKML